MDLASMLNNDGDDNSSRRTKPSATPQERPTPAPPLSTELRSPYSTNGSRQSANEYPFPTTARPTWQQAHNSQPPPPPAPPPSIGPTTHNQSYSQAGTPASPYGPPGSATTPGGYQQHSGHPHHHLPSRNSLSRTPSSPYDQPHSAQQESPISVRSYSQHVSAHTPRQQSLPGTPLGPPTNHYQYREPQPPPLYQQTSIMSHASHASTHAPSPHSQAGRPRTPPHLYNERNVNANTNTSAYREREKSISVSPKTIPGNFSRQILQEMPTPTRGTFFSYPPGYTGEARARNREMNYQAAIEKKVQADNGTLLKRPSTSPGSIKPGVKSEPQTLHVKTEDPPPLPRSISDQLRDPNAMVVDRGQVPDPVHELSTASIAKHALSIPQHREPQSLTTPQPPPSQREDLSPTPSGSLKRSYDAGPASTDIRPVERPAKRTRYKEPPIWAQKSKNNALWKRDGRNHVPPPLKPTASASNALLTNGHSATPARATHPAMQSMAQPEFDSGEGPLGPWEPSFTNVIPHEELTRKVSHFLFHHVVNDESLRTGAAGGVPSSEGQLEIEAKLGRIIDHSSGERLRLPIETEAVLSENFRVSFESSMTEAHHEKMNNYLNTVVKDSRTPAPKPRIPIIYKHTHETDTFYELPPNEISALPPSLQRYLKLNPNHKPKIRISRESRSGNVIAKIIKVRVADLHVYSPATEFDWRISVNVEMNWDGDLNALVTSLGGAKRAPDRHKDRMSYSHLAFQIDLTQVKGENLTHELEVEVSSDVVRQQGQLAKEGKPTQYEELIRGFVDDVRLLTRVTKEH